MQRPTSLALRVTLLFGLAAAIVFPVFGWFIDHSIDQHFIEEDQAEMERITNAARQALASINNKNSPYTLRQRLGDILVGHHHASLLITQRGATPIFASHHPDLSALIREVSTSSQNRVHQWREANRSYRALIRNVENNGRFYIVAVAVPIDHHLQFLEKFHHTLWLMTAGAIALMSLLGWIAVRQGHAPLHNIVARIRQISANELNTRLTPEAVPRELTDLALSFNEMLSRVEAAFVRLSNFSADIAHELRTPITNLMTQTQVALSQSRSADEYREILYSNVEEYERLAQMIGDMLFLAQADNGQQTLSTSTIDLASEVNSLFEYYEAWAEEHRVTLMQTGVASVTGDRLMLRRALSNLISNAIRHTPAGQTVSVKLHAGPGEEITINIENPGTPIPPQHLPKLFDRFYRVDPSRQRSGEGAGLGLAIVKSIVEAHGGKIEVESGGDGTVFRITLYR